MIFLALAWAALCALAARLSLILLFLSGVVPFLVSAAWLESLGSGCATLLYDAAGLSPFYLLLRKAADPWVSSAIYEDSPFHYAFEAASGRAAFALFPLAGLLAAKRMLFSAPGNSR